MAVASFMPSGTTADIYKPATSMPAEKWFCMAVWTLTGTSRNSSFSGEFELLDDSEGATSVDIGRIVPIYEEALESRAASSAGSFRPHWLT